MSIPKGKTLPPDGADGLTLTLVLTHYCNLELWHYVILLNFSEKQESQLAKYEFNTPYLELMRTQKEGKETALSK